MRINRKLYLAVIIGLIFFILPLSAQAICPICTIAVGACVGLSRYLGVDDLITGLWIGGLIVSMILWTIGWLDKKNVRFYGRKIAVAAAYYAVVIGPFYYSGIMGHPFNKFWGWDKLGLGIAIGSLGFILGVGFHSWLKRKNGGKSYFPFQKVALPIIPLIILSIVFYYFNC